MTATFLLAFARCAGFVSRAPGFSHPSVPRTLRVGLAALLAMPFAHSTEGRTTAPVAFAVAAAAEAALGAAIGFAASLLYDGAYAGGRLLDDYVGIKGSVPNANTFAPSGFGRVFSLAALAGFFVFGGYRYVVLTFARSFDRIPLGFSIGTDGLHRFAFALPASILEAAVFVAAPAIAVTVCAQLALACVNRVVPRFATFALSFPLVFAAALIATIVTVPLVFVRGGQPWIPFPGLTP